MSAHIVHPMNVMPHVLISKGGHYILISKGHVVTITEGGPTL